MGSIPTFKASTPAANSNAIARFGSFEVDVRAGELRKNGLKIKLHGQPLEVLLMLLEHPGQVVAREELHQKLWAADTSVDFEHGLNKAINRLREALGDDAENPRFIETLPRRGYRFVGPAVAVSPQDRVPEEHEIAKEVSRPERTGSKRSTIALAVAMACVLGTAGFFWIRWETRAPRVLNYRQLTWDRQLKGENPCEMTVPLVTDGPRIYFAERPFPLVQVSVRGGDDVKVPVPFLCFTLMDISPDKTELLGNSVAEATEFDGPLWSLSIANGQVYRLGNLTGHAGAWSPDGQRIAYAVGNGPYVTNELRVAEKDGSGSTKLAETEAGLISRTRWSLDGKSLRLTIIKSGIPTVWEISAQGTDLHRLELFPGDKRGLEQTDWAAGGRYSLFTLGRVGASELWARRESRLFRNFAKPVQLTTGAMIFNSAVSGTDGKEVFAIGGQARGELVRFDNKTGALAPFLGGISAQHLDFSRDGQWITYVDFPEHRLWRSRVDGSERVQLTKPPLWVVVPRWSPDGKQIAFSALLPEAGAYIKTYVISTEGGQPELIGEAPTHMVDPTWTADGKNIIFGGSGFDAHAKLYSFELQTRRASVIPGSEGKYSPRVSPDGRYMVAVGSGNVKPPGKMFLYDMQKGEWSELLRSSSVGGGWPVWSNDSKYLYFRFETTKTELRQYRVRLSDRKMEETAVIQIPEGITGWANWMGATPDGSPLVLRDASLWEVYALDVEWP